MAKRILPGIAILAMLLLALGTAAASDEEAECEPIGPDDIDVCAAILDHWTQHDGADRYGQPVMSETTEVNPSTGEALTVQYFEYARLEIHPDLDGTPYHVQVGRLGAELLADRGIDWREYEDGDADDPTWNTHTGQAIAPEFQEFWMSFGDAAANGLDSGQASLARFGYPISPAEDVDDDEIVLTQWFERVRLELDADDVVSVAAVGLEATETSLQDGLAQIQGFDARLQEILEEHGDPGIGIWLESSTLGDHEWTAGVANHETDEPYTPETHHRIGSVSKPLTALTVLSLVEDGLLDLDATIDQWFPELEGGDQVTVRMLGNMTSGIYNYTDTIAWYSQLLQDPEQVWEPEDLLWYGFEMTDAAEPDSTWSYSNTNYVMLGLIVEDLTGGDFGAALEERVLEPLGLDDTSFPGDGKLPEPYARATFGGAPGSSEQDATNWHPSASWTAGQVVSTSEDMLRFAPELAGSQLLSDELNEERLDLIQLVDDEAWDVETMGDQPPGYGFGVFYSDGWYLHDGMIFGYATLVAHHPEWDVSVVIFGNGDGLNDDMITATGAAFGEIERLLAEIALD